MARGPMLQPLVLTAAEIAQLTAWSRRPTTARAIACTSLDNLSTHKAPTVTRWLAQHPRDHLHCTPTSSSWLNQGHLGCNTSGADDQVIIRPA